MHNTRSCQRRLQQETSEMGPGASPAHGQDHHVQPDGNPKGHQAEADRTAVDAEHHRHGAQAGGGACVSESWALRTMTVCARCVDCHLGGGAPRCNILKGKQISGGGNLSTTIWLQLRFRPMSDDGDIMRQ